MKIFGVEKTPAYCSSNGPQADRVLRTAIWWEVENWGGKRIRSVPELGVGAIRDESVGLKSQTLGAVFTTPFHA